MMLDATQNYGDPLTEERIYGWHAALFPTGHSGMRKVPWMWFYSRIGSGIGPTNTRSINGNEK